MRNIATIAITLLICSSCTEDATINVLSVYPNKNNLLIDESFEGIISLESCRQKANQIISDTGYENADYECGFNCKKVVDEQGNFYICQETLK